MSKVSIKEQIFDEDDDISKPLINNISNNNSSSNSNNSISGIKEEMFTFYLAYIKEDPNLFSSWEWLWNKILVFIEGGVLERGIDYLYEQPLKHVEFISQEYWTYGICEGSYDNNNKYIEGIYLCVYIYSRL